jgi:hypothetical protein
LLDVIQDIRQKLELLDCLEAERTALTAQRECIMQSAGQLMEAMQQSAEGLSAKNRHVPQAKAAH